MYSISVKSYRIGLKEYGVFVQKSLSLKKYFERKNSQTLFCCLCVNLPTVKIWGQSDNFPMSFSFLQCPLQVKKLIRENCANMSIRQVNFTSGQNFKPPFLCQYLIFFHDFFFTLEISFGSKLSIWRYTVTLMFLCNVRPQFVFSDQRWYLSKTYMSFHE